MNPEPPRDWLDEALVSRAAMTPPSDFTDAVMRAVAPHPRRPPVPTFLTEEGVRLGLALAAAGLLSTVDPGAVGPLLNRAGRSPEAAVVLAFALSLAWFVRSRRTDLS